MSNKEKAIQLLDQIPESEMDHIIWILEHAVRPDKTNDSHTRR